MERLEPVRNSYAENRVKGFVGSVVAPFEKTLFPWPLWHQFDRMDKAQRSELIRALYNAKAGGMAYVPSGRPIKAKPVRPVVERIVMGWPLIIPDTKRVPKFWLKPEEPKRPTLAVKRTGRVSALTRIAEKWRAAPTARTSCYPSRTPGQQRKFLNGADCYS